MWSERPGSKTTVRGETAARVLCVQGVPVNAIRVSSVFTWVCEGKCSVHCVVPQLPTKSGLLILSFILYPSLLNFPISLADRSESKRG